MITDFVISTIKYMGENLKSEDIGAIIIIALILLFVISLVLLVFRRTRLWYWKINEQITALEKIDQNLEEIKQTLPEILVSQKALMQQEHNETQEQEPYTEIEAIIESCDKDVKEDSPEAGENPENPEIFFDKFEKEDRDHSVEMKSKENVGKTGMIYIEEILREQIQF